MASIQSKLISELARQVYLIRITNEADELYHAYYRACCRRHELEHIIQIVRVFEQIYNLTINNQFTILITFCISYLAKTRVYSECF